MHPIGPHCAAVQMPQKGPLGLSQIFRKLFLTPKQKLKMRRQKRASQGEDNWVGQTCQSGVPYLNF